MLHSGAGLQSRNFFLNLKAPIVCIDSEKISEEVLLGLVDTIPQIGNSCCYTSQDESLNHPASGSFLRECGEKNVNVGLVTNGVLIDKYLDEIMTSCSWVSVGIITSSASKYAENGGSAIEFYKIFNNIKSLVRRRTSEFPRVILSFYMIPDNCTDVYDCAKIGKDIGVDFFNILPCLKKGSVWYPEMLSKTFKTIDRAVRLSTNNYKIYNFVINFNEVVSLSVV